MTAEPLPLTPSAPLRFVVPFPPEPKPRPRVSFHGGKARAYTPPSTRRAEDRIRLAVVAELPDGWEPLTVPLRLTVVVYVARPKSIPRSRWSTALPAKRPDLANYVMLAQDALSGLVYADDALVVDLAATKRYSVEPRWELTVEVVE